LSPVTHFSFDSPSLDWEDANIYYNYMDRNTQSAVAIETYQYDPTKSNAGGGRGYCNRIIRWLGRRDCLTEISQLGSAYWHQGTGSCGAGGSLSPDIKLH
jgi:hypothetical protein